MKQKPPSRTQGFTLVELMVVIVIMAIMASLVMLNINGVDQRKAAQVRDFFIMDVQKIAREANDQARVLALEVHPATDVADFSYAVVEYKNPQFTMPPEQQNNAMLNHQKWQKYNRQSNHKACKKSNFHRCEKGFLNTRKDNIATLRQNSFKRGYHPTKDRFPKRKTD